MDPLEEIAEQGVAEHERFLADLKAMDYAWLQATRQDSPAPFDSWLNNYIEREANRG